MAKITDVYGDAVTVALSAGYVRVASPHYGSATTLTNFYTPRQAKALREAIRKAEKKAAKR